MEVARRVKSALVLKYRGVRIDQPGQRDDACGNSQSLHAHRPTALVRNRPGKGCCCPPLGVRGYKRDCRDRARPAAAASIIGRCAAPRTRRQAASPWDLGHRALINI